MGLHVLHRVQEHVERRLVREALLQDVGGTVDDLLGGGLLAADHHAIDELGQQPTVVLRVGFEEDVAGAIVTRHCGDP